MLSSTRTVGERRYLRKDAKLYRKSRQKRLRMSVLATSLVFGTHRGTRHVSRVPRKLIHASSGPPLRDVASFSLFQSVRCAQRGLHVMMSVLVIGSTRESAHNFVEFLSGSFGLDRVPSSVAKCLIMLSATLVSGHQPLTHK